MYINESHIDLYLYLKMSYCTGSTRNQISVRYRTLHGKYLAKRNKKNLELHSVISFATVSIYNYIS